MDDYDERDCQRKEEHVRLVLQCRHGIDDDYEARTKAKQIVASGAVRWGEANALVYGADRVPLAQGIAKLMESAPATRTSSPAPQQRPMTEREKSGAKIAEGLLAMFGRGRR
jgi:hypothetical protein